MGRHWGTMTHKDGPGALCAFDVSSEDACVETVYKVLEVCTAHCSQSVGVVGLDVVLVLGHGVVVVVKSAK